jgi:hypothetical protein
MERFLLLWDEIDEVVGACRYLAAGVAHSWSLRARRVRRLIPVFDRAA